MTTSTILLTLSDQILMLIIRHKNVQAVFEKYRIEILAELHISLSYIRWLVGFYLNHVYFGQVKRFYLILFTLVLHRQLTFDSGSSWSTLG